MITYKFDVTQSRVRLVENTDKATEGSINFIKCIFNLSEEYNNLLVDAVFNGERVPLVNGECFAPPLTGVSCTVGIIGYELEGDEYALRISPAPVYFTVEKGSYSDNMFPQKIPEPSVLEQYYNQIKELVDSGVMKGDKGDKGDPGEQGPQGEQGPPGKDAEIDKWDLVFDGTIEEENFQTWFDLGAKYKKIHLEITGSVVQDEDGNYVINSIGTGTRAADSSNMVLYLNMTGDEKDNPEFINDVVFITDSGLYSPYFNNVQRFILDIDCNEAFCHVKGVTDQNYSFLDEQPDKYYYQTTNVGASAARYITEAVMPYKYVEAILMETDETKAKFAPGSIVKIYGVKYTEEGEEQL